MTPEVSILTTVYNGEAHLLETLESVLCQRLVEFEYVIVDDGSSDGTQSLLGKLDDERIRVVTLPRSGRGVALNRGLAECRASFVAILDADDVAYPWGLAVMHAVMEQHPEIAVLGGACHMRGSAPPAEAGLSPRPRIVSPRELIRRTPVAHSAVMMRTESIKAVGGYAAGRKSLFDYDLWLRLIERGLTIGRIDVPVAYHRIHARQSFERRKRLEYLKGVFQLRRRAARLYGERWFDSLLPFATVAFGLIPMRVRRRLFRLAGE